MSKDKETVIDAEVTSEEEVKTEEVKEGRFKKFIKKTKQSVNDAVLESKIESSFNKANQSFCVYSKDDFFSKSLFGKLEGTTLTVFGSYEFDAFSIVIDEKTQAAYTLVSCAEATVTSVVDGVEYERTGTAITLSTDVTEVKVIKAGKRYFLYKGEK